MLAANVVQLHHLPRRQWTAWHDLIYCIYMNMLTITKEIEMLRSFAVSIIGRDAEGEYRPEFVREVLHAVHEKPLRRFHFTNAKAFLAEIEQADA